jgi:hypothetical protein
MIKKILYTVGLCVCLTAVGITQTQNMSNHGNKFEQLGTLLPTQNEYRLADGSAGPKYWQQRCDYDITCTLDEKKHRLTGNEKITYYNNSPRALTYLWLQLDENQHKPGSDNQVFDESEIGAIMTETDLRFIDNRNALQDKGINITRIADAANTGLKYTINQTMMRVELVQPLKSGEKFIMQVKWTYNLVERVPDVTQNARGGYEFFSGDGNSLYTIAQWYPRLCVYSDFQGWQNHQFTGRGEFALTFGNFKVQMTVPADHVIGATGECQNYQQVLSPSRFARLKQAQQAKEPFEIVTLSEAKLTMKKPSAATSTKTWIFKADNVRDFAWASSRRFIWDAMPTWVNGKKIMCMSYYGPEAYPIYSRYSTKTVAHTIRTYSKYTIPYPYPVAQGVEGDQGMEYPMIAFNPGRAEKDGTYSEAEKNSCISVTIHEVGHNFFPMIINSDERQWTWMDEGINSFLEFLTEKEFDVDFPSGMGPTTTITSYMRLPKNQLEPIMTNSENIVRFGSNAYRKTSAALNILRETIMGRELFDYAFKEYSKRWAFKHPTPADFFRTMEDASAVDLDWFWRGWFYGIEAVDISIDSVKWFKIDQARLQPVTVNQQLRNRKRFDDLTRVRNRELNIQTETGRDPALRDFYYSYKPAETADSLINYQFIKFSNGSDSITKAEKYGINNYYQLSFSNKGGLVMPLIIEWNYKDGSREIERIPAEIWRHNETNVTKVFVKQKEIAFIRLDPFRETADINEENNGWGDLPASPSRFQLFRFHKSLLQNPMQRQK